MRFSTFNKVGESQENKLINPIDAAKYWTDGVYIFWKHTSAFKILKCHFKSEKK